MMYVEVFKEELGWATYKRLRVISNKTLFRIIMYISKKLRNRAVLSFQKYCMHCYVAHSNTCFVEMVLRTIW